VSVSTGYKTQMNALHLTPPTHITTLRACANKVRSHTPYYLHLTQSLASFAGQ